MLPKNSWSHQKFNEVYKQNSEWKLGTFVDHDLLGDSASFPLLAANQHCVRAWGCQLQSRTFPVPRVAEPSDLAVSSHQDNPAAWSQGPLELGGATGLFFILGELSDCVLFP